MTELPQAASETDGLGSRMARGAAWVVLMRFSIRFLGVVSTVILARLLTPEDYGLIALATVFAAAVELLSAFNFEIWLIRHPRPDRSHFDTVFTLSLLRGATTALLVVALSAPIAGFYSDARLAAVLWLIAAGIMVSSCMNVGIVNFQRDLTFGKDFVFNAGAKLGAFAVTVTLGFLWRNYWALAVGIVSGHVFQLLLSYGLHPFRPRLSLQHWRDAVGFSKWLLLGSVLSFAHLRADTFILGKIAGNQVLGLYNVAREIANLATSELVAPIRRVIMPGYSKLQGDAEALRQNFVDGFGIIMLIGMPCAIGLGVVADPLIRVLLGAKWLAAIPIMQALVLYGVATVGLANQWPTLVAIGRPRIATTLLAANLVLLLPSLYFAAVHFGSVGVALALGFASTLLFLSGLVAVKWVLKFRWRALWGRLWRTLLACATMAAAVLALEQFMSGNGLPAALTLVSCVATGAVTYAVALCLLVLASRPAGSPEQTLLAYARARLPGRG